MEDASFRAIVIGEGQEDRLDRVLSAALDLSRTRVQRLVAQGLVTVEGRKVSKSRLLSAGEVVEVVVPPPEPVDMAPEDLPLDLVYEDADLAVVNKAAGMVVHPAPGHRTGTLVNALLYHLDGLSSVGGRMRPGIVHRLDRDTSGLLVVAKNDEAHHALSSALGRHRVKRLYRALTWGHLEEDTVTVDAPIGRDPRHRKRMAVVDDGRPAVTRVRVRERWPRADLLDVALRTGRTHQIRVHLAYLGHPVVSDEVYGSGWERGMGGPERTWAQELARRVPRQFLHAAELVFDHPRTGERMRFHAPLPSDLARACSWARSRDGGVS